MNKKKYSALFRLAALLMVMVFLVPAGANAVEAETVQPRASDYIVSYTGYVSAAASGKIQASFSVVGKGTQDSIGALSIQIYRSADNVNWTWVKTYQHSSYSNMLSYNDNHHSGTIEYQGVPGMYYKAYINIWAGSDGDGDNRLFYTNTVKAVVTPS